jgi:hypothetical protein
VADSGVVLTTLPEPTTNQPLALGQKKPKAKVKLAQTAIINIANASCETPEAATISPIFRVLTRSTQASVLFWRRSAMVQVRVGRHAVVVG